MGWVEILPAFESLFQRHGMESAAAFLNWTGDLVNRHRHRQVEQVTLFESDRFYVKKQTAVTWRERFRNAWDGFGWCATAVREGAMFQALHRASIGCPEVAALGEAGRRAFVVLREAVGMCELRVALQECDQCGRARLAVALGRELARMHDAGFDHPDLFAKHILADTTANQFCIIDWQRGRYRRRVSWQVRTRDLAVLDATLHAALAGDRLRFCCLRAYHAATAYADRPPLGRLARDIRAAAGRLHTLRRIREVGQLPTPARDQMLTPLLGGRILVARSFADRLHERWPDAWMNLAESATHIWDLLSALACTVGAEKVVLHAWPGAGAAADIPPLAHTIFRLQRFGVPAPRLLAVGATGTAAHVLMEVPQTTPFAEAFAKAEFAQRSRWLERAGIVVRKIHEAGYRLPAGHAWERRLGIAVLTGDVVLASAEPLVCSERTWQETAPAEFNQQSIHLTRSEQLRFLQGYLQGDDGSAMPGTRAGERQAVA
jgi:tRNA A-37 threonylcarbamoyl transferase component Bud32